MFRSQQHSPLKTLPSSKEADRSLLGFLWVTLFTLVLTAPFLLSTGTESSDEASAALLSITDKSLMLSDAFTGILESGFSFWVPTAWSWARISVTELDFEGSSSSISSLLRLRPFSSPTRRRAAITAIFLVLAKTGLAGVTGLTSSLTSSVMDEGVGEVRSLSPSSVKLRSFFIFLGVGRDGWELAMEDKHIQEWK